MPLAAGAKLSWPPAISAALTSVPAVTGVPFSSSVPLAGRVSMRTALRVWPASASVNAKSAGVSATGVSSGVVTVRSALSGGVLVPTLTVTVAVSVAPAGSVTV